MNRGTALLVAVAVFAGIVAVAPVGIAVAQDDSGGTAGANETGETADISPGEQLSGVIGVQNAEISGEVESRAFGVGLDRAETDAERAAFVAERLNRSEQRLAEIEQRQRELRDLREAGELSQGAFAARMAETSARAERIRRETNRSADVARGIPESVRTEQGLGTERLSTIRDRANNATGPEVAAIARGVAGGDVGGPLAPGSRGPRSDRPDRGPDRPGNGDGPPGGGSPANETDAPSGNATNATDTANGSNAGERPEKGEANATNGSNAGGETGDANGSGAAGGTNESTDASGADDAGGSDRAGRNPSETDGNATNGTGDAGDRGENRSVSAVKTVISGLSSAADGIGNRLTATVAGGFGGGA